MYIALSSIHVAMMSGSVYSWLQTIGASPSLTPSRQPHTASSPSSLFPRSATQEWVPKSQVNLTKFIPFTELDHHVQYVATSFIPRPLCAKQKRKQSLPSHLQS